MDLGFQIFGPTSNVCRVLVVFDLQLLNLQFKLMCLAIIGSKGIPCLLIAFKLFVSSIFLVSSTVKLSIVSLPSIFSCHVLMSLMLTFDR